MPVTFYGRTTEFEALNDELEQVRSGGRTRLVAIRGRRQVGKSTLVERFAETAGVPYASLPGMKGTTEATQVSYSLEALRSSLRPLPDRAILEAATPPSTWVRVLSLIPFAVGETPTIVVLDEFPWMMEASSERLDGLLKAMLDGEFRRRQVLLILVGSDEAMMEQLFKHDQPLFNKADRLLVVSPFNPAETAAALGGTRTALQVFDAQLVTGGFPGLVEQAKREGSIKNFVVASLSKADSPLVDAAQIRLAGELLESENAVARPFGDRRRRDGGDQVLADRRPTRWRSQSGRREGRPRTRSAGRGEANRCDRVSRRQPTVEAQALPDRRLISSVLVPLHRAEPPEHPSRTFRYRGEKLRNGMGGVAGQGD